MDHQARQVPLDHRAIKSFITEVLLPQIKRWLEHQDPEKPIGTVKPGRIATGTLTSVAFDRGYQRDLDVTVMIGAEGSSKPGTAVLGGGASLKHQVVHIMLNGAYWPAKMLSEKHWQPIGSCQSLACVAYSIYSVLIHELTHMAEAWQNKPVTYKVKREGPGLPQETDRNQYLNDPSEVRAFTQEIVEQATRGFRHTLRMTGWTLQKRVEFALRFSDTWQMIEKDLTPANRAKIFKALYQELDRSGLLDVPTRVAARWLTGEGLAS